MLVKYQGPSGGVTIDEHDPDLIIRAGDIVDVADDVGARLIIQGHHHDVDADGNPRFDAAGAPALVPPPDGAVPWVAVSPPEASIPQSPIPEVGLVEGSDH